MHLDREQIGYKLLMFLLVLSVVYYAAMFAYEVYARKQLEGAVATQWLDACVAQHDATACEASLDTLNDDCLRESRTSRDRIRFRPTVFFECMNERNTAAVDVDVPEPEQWERL